MVQGKPDEHPYEAKKPGHYEGPSPPVVDRYPGHGERRNNGSDISSGIEYASGKRSLLFGKPLGSGLYGRRKVAAFAKTQCESGCTEADHGACQGVAHCCNTPYHYRKSVPDLAAQFVHEAAGHQEPDRVGGLECQYNMGVLEVVPSDRTAKVLFQYAEDLAVDIVDGGRKEQQCAYYPPAIAHTRIKTRGRDSLNIVGYFGG